jgi:4,5-DOPA dioxygenase extradiol
MKMPVLFIGHGSPMIGIEENDVTRALAKLGRELPRPRAVAVASAHWVASGTRVAVSEKPKLIYDFYGFSPELYKVKYPAPGISREIREWMVESGFQTDELWGLDHGAWTILKHLYPKADIPVFQVSLDQGKSFKGHFELGRKLQPLRDKDVLIIGSGNLTHNLIELIYDDNAKPYPWAVEFDAKAKKALDERDSKAFIKPEDYFSTGLFREAHPTTEHYVPLLYAIGAATDKDQVNYPYEGIQYASLSMRMVKFG